MKTILIIDSLLKVIKKSSYHEQEWIKKIILNLSINLEQGKPLRYNWLREKKFHDKRLLYIIDFQKEKGLIIAYKNKKKQQETIDYIIKNKKEFFSYLD